jgi:hypothetical protein
MRGQWIAAASRRVFSQESVELLIEPAIADLQLEDSGRFAARVEAYRTVWIGMAAAFDDGVAQRAREFVRDNDLVTITLLVSLHAIHSAWMLALLLNLDGRVHLGRMLSAGLADLATPGVLAASSVLVLYAGRALVKRLSKKTSTGTQSIVRVVE